MLTRKRKKRVNLAGWQKYFSDTLCCKWEQRGGERHPKLLGISRFLGQNVQFFLCSPFGDWIPGSRPSLMINVKILISKTASAPYRQDHLGFLWPTEAAVKSPLLLTSNMSKHVKFHFCGIFFIGGYQLGEWVCWNVEGRVKMSPSLISWRRTPPHHSCHPFHMALIRLTSTTPHSLGIGHSPVDLNIHTSFHCEWVHKYNQLFGPVSVWVEIKFQLDLSPGSKCSR